MQGRSSIIHIILMVECTPSSLMILIHGVLSLQWAGSAASSWTTKAASSIASFVPEKLSGPSPKNNCFAGLLHWRGKRELIVTLEPFSARILNAKIKIGGWVVSRPVFRKLLGSVFVNFMRNLDEFTCFYGLWVSGSLLKGSRDQLF